MMMDDSESTNTFKRSVRNFADMLDRRKMKSGVGRHTPTFVRRIKDLALFGSIFLSNNVISRKKETQ